MAVFNAEQQEFVVKALACFDTPSQVAELVKEEYGLDVNRQTIHAYDPTRANGQKKLAEKWKVLFEKTRKAFIEDTSDIAIAHRSARIRRLNRMANKAEKVGNMVLATNIIEQAAKEMGNSYTNRRELSGVGGGPIQTIDMSKLSDSSLEDIVAAGDAIEDGDK